MSVVLVCDLGGTHFRAALVDADGARLAEHKAVCPAPNGAAGWWEIVSPQPAGLAGTKPRPSMPSLQPGQRFWEAGCADFCR